MASPRATGRQPADVSSRAATERYKQQAAQAAADMVTDGMRVGLGSGTTVAYLVQALAQRPLSDVAYAVASPATERAARTQGLEISELDELAPLDLAIDGADQIDPEGWLIKGGGAAHTREKVVAAAAGRFIVIASAEKAVERLAPPVPLELLRFGVETTLRALSPAKLRAVPPSPDGGLIADYLGPIAEPRELAARLSDTPGVVEHGLFAPEMVTAMLLAGAGGVHQRAGAKLP